jgi:hypothetical protein
LDLILDSQHESFCKDGSVRLALVRKNIGVDLTQDKINAIVELYRTWRDTSELLPMRLKYKQNTFIDLNDTAVDPDKWIHEYNVKTGLTAVRLTDSPNCNIVAYEGYCYEWVLQESCKRGNDVYVKQLEYKFKKLFSKNHISFFSTILNDKRKRVRKTSLLYITGTCDPKITGSMSASWITFGASWNSFITNLRQQFGSIRHLRTWQSQDNGYPHFHALLYFNDFEFTAVHWQQDNSWRIHNKQKLDGKYVRDRIKDAWGFGHLDVKCCNNTKDALNDLLKYVLRDLDHGSCDLTNAMIWYFRKQSFGISDGFKQLFDIPESASVEPTDADLINAEGVIQISNSNCKLVAIEVYPLIRRDKLPKFIQKDVLDPYRIEDPPPEFKDFLDGFAVGCKVSKISHRSDGVLTYVFKEVD